MSTNPTAAGLLEQNAPRIARRACGHLLDINNELADRFGSDAQELWTDHLQQRTLELSAALAAGDSRLFSSRLNWSRIAMQARDISARDLQSSLESLRTGVSETLEGEPKDAALDCIDEALESLQESTSGAEQSELDAGLLCDRLALDYVQTVVAGNVATGIQLVLDAVSHGLPIRDAYLKVLLPAQQEVGRLWHLNELSVSEEHLVSYTTQRIMALLSTRMPRKPDNGFTVIAGAVSGNVHDIGIRAISYLLEFDGWRTIYLGSDIPRKELPATIETFGADVLMLSVALTTQIPATERAIAEVRLNCKPPVSIMVGGNGLVDQPERWREMGADAYAGDALQALEMALDLARRNSS